MYSKAQIGQPRELIVTWDYLSPAGAKDTPPLIDIP